MSVEQTTKSYLPLVEKYVVDSFSKDGKLSTRGKHLLKTKDWLLKLYPEADEAMQIAAVAHDIDSAFVEYTGDSGFNDPDYLRDHQIGAAAVLGNFLDENGVDVEIIEKVKHLVEKHEVGGDDGQNMVKDADSLGFFDRDLHDFINRHLAKGSDKDKIREKFDWMYDRITSSHAKAFAKPMYDEAIRLLGELDK